MRIAVLLLAVLPACSPTAQPTAPLSTLMVTWPNYFRIESETAQARGRTIVRGTVYNTSNHWMKDIQLLIDGLDASGAVVNQRVAWLGTDLTGGAHVYFESLTPGPAASYRVSIFAFDKKRPS
jgi:hypothetical protein